MIIFSWDYSGHRDIERRISPNVYLNMRHKNSEKANTFPVKAI